MDRHMFLLSRRDNENSNTPKYLKRVIRETELIIDKLSLKEFSKSLN